MTFTIRSQHGPVDHDVTVFYTLSGTAHNGSDFTITPMPVGQVTIFAGQSVATVTAHVLIDGINEKKETFTLTLINRPNYTITRKFNKATVTIGKNRT